jgi:hypothetical protein
MSGHHQQQYPAPSEEQLLDVVFMTSTGSIITSEAINPNDKITTIREKVPHLQSFVFEFPNGTIVPMEVEKVLPVSFAFREDPALVDGIHFAVFMRVRSSMTTRKEKNFRSWRVATGVAPFRQQCTALHKLCCACVL